MMAPRHESRSVGACDHGHMRVMTCDVSRAYFYAPAIRLVQVTFVDGDFETGGEHPCAQFNAPLRGSVVAL